MTLAPTTPLVITLTEFGSVETALSPEVYAALNARYVKQFGVTPTEQQGVYRIAARDYVGRVGLPSGGILVVRPKVDIANLFYMLCADAGLAGFVPPPTGLSANPDIFAFVLAALLHAVERLAASGLYRDYTQREERLPFVRGRILLERQLQSGGLHHTHACRFADLAIDNAENRVLAATLRYLPHLLRDNSTEKQLARRVRALLPRFHGVRSIRRGEAISLLSALGTHRLNAAYAPVLALCRLALHRMTLDERPGPHPFASFLVDMPRLFESFLTRQLARLLPEHGLRVVAQRYDYLDEGRTVGIRPDVLVYPRSGRTPALVLDAKYRRPSGPEGDLNRDLYQVSAYLDRYDLRQGVLVYPQFGDQGASRLKLRGTPKHLHIATLNLAAPNPTELDRECAALAVKVAHLAGESAAV
jgi:5-methylcytosine-specific restriction enzyme subunit McrC